MKKKKKEQEKRYIDIVLNTEEIPSPSPLFLREEVFHLVPNKNTFRKRQQKRKQENLPQKLRLYKKQQLHKQVEEVLIFQEEGL